MIRSLLPRLVFLLALAAAACSDGSMGAAPSGPPSLHQVGVIRGTVVGDTLYAEFVPMGAQGAVNTGWNPAVSPSQYGGPGTVKVSGTIVSGPTDVVPVSRTWVFNVHMENLLSYPIGSNYTAGNSAPPDTSGVFLIYTVPPTVLLPSPCACTVTDTSYSGVGNFGSPGQKYHWYRSRPTAVTGTPGTDTTGNVPWKFVATPQRPSTGDTVHSFSFVLTVNAAWPSPSDNVWAYSYNWKTDSVPDTTAEPRFKPAFRQLKNYKVLGTETWSAATGLTLTADANNKSIYLAQDDSLDPSWDANVAATMKVGGAIVSHPIQALLGLVDSPNSASAKQAVLGIWSDSVYFVTLNANNGTWSRIAGSGWKVDMTQPHALRLQKFGTLDIHLCLDGVAVVAVSRSQLEAPIADFTQSGGGSPTTMFFSTLGDNSGTVTTVWTAFSYGIGTYGATC